ncbi:MAG TPA: hypothetical protein VG033_01670 [Candidatus Acidoferrales bacterium]|jgi:hypothetical protein|nr:hypothetical protein [Candidatus Acidoferrales bacterium]
MSKRKRIFVPLGIAVVVAGVYLWFFGVQTMCAFTVRYSYRKTPDVSKIPVALTDLSISGVPHRKVSYFGYEFELPWDDTDEQKDKTIGQIHVSAFHSGNAFWFSTFPPKAFVNEIMKTANLDARGFRQVYGDEAFESDYGFMSRMLRVTPEGITPFVSRKQAVAGQMLLLIKAISMPKADSGIFSIGTQEFRGFQYENPQSRPFRITVELYSNDGGVDLMFLQKAGGSAPNISQAEINRVIQSIHKIP